MLQATQTYDIPISTLLDATPAANHLPMATPASGPDGGVTSASSLAVQGAFVSILHLKRRGRLCAITVARCRVVGPPTKALAHADVAGPRAAPLAVGERVQIRLLGGPARTNMTWGKNG